MIPGYKNHAPIKLEDTHVEKLSKNRMESRQKA